MRSKVVFFIAFIAFIVGIAGVYTTITSGTKEKPKVEVPMQSSPEPYLTLWYATTDLHKGYSLSHSNVKKIQLPLSQAAKEGVKADVQLDFSPSTLLNIDVASDDLILPEYQTKPNQPGYIDLLVSDGMTLYPLEVSDNNLIKDYIRPGSFIDIFTISSPVDNLADRSDKLSSFYGVEARLFLKQIKVLSIEGFDGEIDKQIKGTLGAVSPSASPAKKGMIKVVIEIKPELVTKLALAERTMHLEIFRSQNYTNKPESSVSDIIENYTPVQQIRGGEQNHTADRGGY